MSPQFDTSHTSERLLKVYGLYRLVLAALLYFLALTNLLPNSQGGMEAEGLHLLEFWFALAVLNVASFWLKQWKRVALESIILPLDIVVISVLSTLSGGVETGLVFLTLPSIASAGLCLQRRTALGIAALGVTVILGSQARLFWIDQFDPRSSTLIAWLGILFFLVTTVMLFLRNSLDKTAQAAANNEAKAQQLTLLNETVLQRMLTGIITVDRDGEFILINPAARKMLGIDPSIAHGSLRLNQFDRLLRSYRRWIKNPNFSASTFVENKSGRTIHPVFRHVATDPDYLDLIFLEDAGSLTRQAQEIKIQSLEKISAGVAHEIRNPLSAISQANELLKLSDNLGNDDTKMIEIIDRHCDRMNKIIETIFTMSRRLEPHIETILLKRWLQEFVDEYIETESEGGAQIDYSMVNEHIEVEFDTGHLRQVLINLIDNGLRYSKIAVGRGTITLSTPTYSTVNTPVWLDIRDGGAGIPVELRDKIFDPFFTTENHGGTGLGLYMAQELCQSNFASLDYVCKNTAPSEDGFFRISFRTSDKDTN